MLEEYPFGFIGSQFTLQSIASNEVALNLLRYNYFSPPPTPKRNYSVYDGLLLMQEGFRWDEVLSVPSRIKTAINEKIKLVRKQLTGWIHFFSIAVRSKDACNCFHCIVLSPDGTISYKETASNIVKQSHLNDVEKYKIACNFCLEDDVRRIWPLVSKNPLVIGESVQDTNLVYHWNCRMMRKKDPVPATVRIQSLIRTKNHVATEYFFDMLSHEKKISKAITIIRSSCLYDADDLKLRLLRKLNVDQARRVFGSQSWAILSLLIKHEEYFGYLLDLWTAVKDGVFEYSRKFPAILSRLWMEVFNKFNSNVDRDLLNSLLNEVWTSAPANLKSSFAKDTSRLQKFFTRLNSNSWTFSRSYSHDMTFMLQVFELTDYRVRNALWMHHWRKLAVRTELSQLEKFMELSLPDSEAVEKFKRDYILKFTLLYRSFIEKGRYSDFSKYLRFFCKDPKRIRGLSKQALKSNVDLIILADSDNFDKFETFVSEIFSNSAVDVEKFKMEMIFSKKATDSLSRAFGNNSMEDFVKMINSFVFSDESLRELKKKILNICQNRLNSDRHFLSDHGKWVKLLEWCSA